MKKTKLFLGILFILLGAVVFFLTAQYILCPSNLPIGYWKFKNKIQVGDRVIYGVLTQWDGEVLEITRNKKHIRILTTGCNIPVWHSINEVKEILR